MLAQRPSLSFLSLFSLFSLSPPPPSFHHAKSAQKSTHRHSVRALHHGTLHHCCGQHSPPGPTYAGHVNDVDNDGELVLELSVVDKHNAANLNEASEDPGRGERGGEKGKKEG